MRDSDGILDLSPLPCPLELELSVPVRAASLALVSPSSLKSEQRLEALDDDRLLAPPTPANQIYRVMH